MKPAMRVWWASCLVVAASVWAWHACGAEDLEKPRMLLKPGLFKSLTEPQCSYCSTQHRKKFVQADDRVVAPREVMAQIAQAQLAGAGGYVVSRVHLDQSWEPRLLRWK